MSSVPRAIATRKRTRRSGEPTSSPSVETRGAIHAVDAVAARALAQGDALGALKVLGPRGDPTARALRAVALAQMGDYAQAKVHARAVLRARGVDAALRARCLAVDAEIALATGDARWDAAPVSRAIAEFLAGPVPGVIAGAAVALTGDTLIR